MTAVTFSKPGPWRRRPGAEEVRHRRRSRQGSMVNRCIETLKGQEGEIAQGEAAIANAPCVQGNVEGGGACPRAQS